MDVYSEVTISKKLARNPQRVQKALRTVAAIVTFSGILVFVLFIPAAILWILYFLSTRFLEVDYEYIQVNDEMDIDLVMGNVARKNMLSFSLSDVIVAAPWDSETLESFAALKPMDFSARDPKNPPYIMICNVNGQTKKLYLQLNEKMLKTLKMRIPVKVEW